MTWLPVAPSQGREQSAVSMTVTAGRSGRRRRIYLTVRPDQLVNGQGTPSWWKVGAKVNVQRGTDRSAGLIRITPGTQHTLRRGRNARCPPMLVFPAFVWCPKGAHAARMLEHDFDAGWIEVTLPPWGVPAAERPDAVIGVKTPWTPAPA